MLDYVLVPLSLVLFLVYHIWLLRQVKRSPASTAIGVARSNRAVWVHAVMKVSGRLITLRDGFMMHELHKLECLRHATISASSSSLSANYAGHIMPCTLQHERHAIVAVQALRNSIMACSLVASGSALAAVAIAAFLATTPVSYIQVRVKGLTGWISQQLRLGVSRPALFFSLPDPCPC